MQPPSSVRAADHANRLVSGCWPRVTNLIPPVPSACFLAIKKPVLLGLKAAAIADLRPAPPSGATGSRCLICSVHLAGANQSRPQLVNDGVGGQPSFARN